MEARAVGMGTSQVSTNERHVVALQGKKFGEYESLGLAVKIAAVLCSAGGRAHVLTVSG